MKTTTQNSNFFSIYFVELRDGFQPRILIARKKYGMLTALSTSIDTMDIENAG